MYDEENIDWLAVYERLASSDILHKGTPHEGSIPHSGRYAWGSGLEPFRREMTFNNKVNELKKQGLSDAEIAKGFGMSINDVRAKKAANKAMWEEATAKVFREMLDAGYSVTDISKETGIKKSTITSAIKNLDKRATNKLNIAKQALQDVLDEGYAVDYGQGVERYLGISFDRLTKAAKILEAEGYNNYSDLSFPQTTNQSQYTPMRVLAPKNMSKADILADMTVIRLPFEYSEDGGSTLEKRLPPVNVARDRIYVRYAEDGGKDRDGTIELRRGVSDLDLGLANYAQVRIAVEGGMYMKGMAHYGDIPDGYDIVYNSKRSKGAPDSKVFKEQDTSNVFNPFGASIKEDDELKLIRTKTYVDEKGKKHQSALNIVSEEGDWENWSKSLASQFLSKQEPKLAKQQLDKALKEHIKEYNEILSVTNPYVKEKLLKSFADGCDSDAVHLKAAALPRQGTFALLPEPSLKPNEIFAPRYDDGEEVILVRYPHGGIFEIPKLKVNNKNKEAIKKIGLDAKDAVGIHPEAASQLSGADFDGDTCLVIPTKGLSIKTEKPLQGLIDFDTEIYNLRSTGKKYKSLTKKSRGQEMGRATNLISDMSVKNASLDELERATKYSMVVIDSYKHDLDYKQAYKDYGIEELKKKYQANPNNKTGYGGATTLISAAKNPIYVKQRITNYSIDSETGEKVFYAESKTGKKYRVELGDTGNEYDRKMKSFRMYEAKDARTLSSGTRIENIYADYANSLKDLGNRARLSYLNVEPIPYSKSAARVYEKQVSSLLKKLDQANMNAPIERQANLIANKVSQIQIDSKENVDKDDEKKIRNQNIKDARSRLGASRYNFKIEADEWEALNAGAVNKSTQREIFKKVADETLKEDTMPRKVKGMSDNQKALAQQLSASGYTIKQIADKLGFSTSTISDALK